MLQKLRSNRSVLSVGPMGTWTWTGPIGPRDQDGPDQSVLEIPLDRVEPILSVRLDSVQNRSVSVGLGPVQTEVVHTWSFQNSQICSLFFMGKYLLYTIYL